MTATQRWAEALDAWAIPPQILDAAPTSPHGFPVELFRRGLRDEQPDTPSRRLAREALPEDGSVLDVGCGAGAAGLALVPPAGLVAGVDESDAMLAAFAEEADARGVPHRHVPGPWPDVADDAPATDVVVCHHVFYNTKILDGFAAELDLHAHRRVVVELTAEHPIAWMNPLWNELWEIERPTRPTADDAVAVLVEVGITPEVVRWTAKTRFADVDPVRRLEFVRRRLCLGSNRDPDIIEALERHPVPVERDLVTLTWGPSLSG